MIDKYINVIPDMWKDKFGNRFVIIKGVGDNILWSCHTDTVHDKPGRQLIQMKDQIISLDPRAKTNCLGADDGAGIWLMLEMIEAGVPGRYVFHRGEECGGLGSAYSSKAMGQYLVEGVDACIALDRKAYKSVITYQGHKTASDEFAKSLALALDMPWLEPDDTGTFTDSKNYASEIGECTNLSVGYFSQHTIGECLDVGYLCALREKLLNFNPTKLVFKRVKGDNAYKKHAGYAGVYGGYYGADDYDDWGFVPKRDTPSIYKDIKKDSVWTPKPKQDHLFGEREQDRAFKESQEWADITEICRRHPGIIAQHLMDLGVTINEVDELIFAETGIVPHGKY